MLHITAVALRLHYNSSTDREQTFVVCDTSCQEILLTEGITECVKRQSIVFVAASHWHNFNFTVFTLKKGLRTLGPQNPPFQMLFIIWKFMRMKGMISQFKKKKNLHRQTSQRSVLFMGW